MITVTWLLFKCNTNLTTRGEVEEHYTHTHGVNINKMKRETSIKVDESVTLKLARCQCISELPNEKRKQLMESWFNACASCGTVTYTEGQVYATLQYHKSAAFMEEAKVAVGTEFYNKFYYSLATIIDHSGDLMLGFTCKWSQIVEAVDAALGPMATVKSLYHFIHNKDYMKGGISPADTFNKINHYIDETQGKAVKTFLHKDGQLRDNKVHKELLKFIAAYEVVEALPN